MEWHALCSDKADIIPLFPWHAQVHTTLSPGHPHGQLLQVMAVCWVGHLPKIIVQVLSMRGEGWVVKLQFVPILNLT